MLFISLNAINDLPQLRCDHQTGGCVVVPMYQALKSQKLGTAASPHTMAEDIRCLIELPNLNLEAVLLKLPLPSLHACCCVSKSLLNLIRSDSEFAQMHLAKSESQLMIQSRINSSIHLVDLDIDATSRVDVKPNFNTPLHSFRVAHSCNGLLLLDSMNMADDIHRCILYNPVTGEYTLLPENVSLYRSVKSVFFYCPKTHQFKVVCAFSPLNPDSDASSDSFVVLDQSSDSDFSMELNLGLDDDTNSEDSDLDSESEDPEPYSDTDSDSDLVYSQIYAMGEIYVKGSDSWESLGNLPFAPITLYGSCHLEKAVHWICADESIPNVIVFFNFETHEFGELQARPTLGRIMQMFIII